MVRVSTSVQPAVFSTVKVILYVAMELGSVLVKALVNGAFVAKVSGGIAPSYDQWYCVAPTLLPGLNVTLNGVQLDD